MTSLTSILILGPDTVAAASPATPVQLIHACRRWGFSSVVPASWGDELIASNVLQRCSARDNRPAIQCSCPRVSERLANNATLLENSVFWLLSPPVAVARYLRALDTGRELHITYAGGCPGSLDESINQRVSANELLLSISARGIDLAAQPTVFEDIIPPDRRRHLSSAAGFPDPQLLWETSAFRIAQPADGDFAVGLAQMLLTDERILIDLSPAMGCICRSSVAAADGPAALLRAPTPIVMDGKVDVARSAPAATPVQRVEYTATLPLARPLHEPPDTSQAVPRASPPRAAYRRQSTWRRQSPRPGVVVARTSGVSPAVADNFPLVRRIEARIVIAVLILLSVLMIGLWIGRWTIASADGSEPPAPMGSASTTQPARPRLP